MVDSRLRSNAGDAEVTTLARAGAVAAHIGNGVVVLCGGRGAHDEGEEQESAKFVHDDCLAYDANGEGQWTTHSRMNL